MRERLREAAWRALAGEGTDGSRVERAVFDVHAEGRTELVTVTVRDGHLMVTSSDGRPDGPHVQAALRVLASAGDASLPEEARPSIPGRERATQPDGAMELSVEPVSPRITVSDRHGQTTLPAGATRTLDGTDQPASADRAALASALDDVLTAVVRAGTREAHGSPSVDESIHRLITVAPDPLPLGIGRWVGRLRRALAWRDVDTLARILDGAARVSEDLTSEEPADTGMARIVSWLGATGDMHGDVEALYDRELIEIGREWLSGIERSGIERRYLVDAVSGEVYREERARERGMASLGPCPRVLTVGFAEIERGASPRRIRPLQYAVSLEVSADDWARVAASALGAFRPLVETYRRALDEFPGLAEPFAMIAPSRYDDAAGALVPVDSEDDPLPLARADDPAGVSVLERLARGHTPEWIAGRLMDAGGQLMLLPCAATAPDADGHTQLHRLR